MKKIKKENAEVIAAIQEGLTKNNEILRAILIKIREAPIH